MPEKDQSNALSGAISYYQPGKIFAQAFRQAYWCGMLSRILPTSQASQLIKALDLRPATRVDATETSPLVENNAKNKKSKGNLY